MPASFLFHAPKSQFAFRILVLFALALLTVVGCARDRAPETAPLKSSAAAVRLLGPDPSGDTFPWPDLQRRFASLPYPLAVGNHWEYSIRVHTTITDNAGQQQTDSFEYPYLVDITDVTNVQGRPYYVQSEYDTRVVGPGPSAQFLVRQDRTGLYNLDILSAAPIEAPSGAGSSAALSERLVASVARTPAAASNPDAYRRAALNLAQRVEYMLHPALIAGSSGRLIVPTPGEITLLRYPLYVGASWIVRVSPRFARRVTSREPLEVPAGQFPAWRIDGSSELYGPNDRATFWYGADGLLRILSHAEANAVDNAGNIIGTVSSDLDQVLASVKLHDPTPIGRFSAEAAGEN
jgi:hypothetical protein